MTCLPVHSWRGLSIAGTGSGAIFSPGGQVHLRQLQQLHHHVALEEGVALRQEHAHDHVVLDEAAQRLAVGGDDVLLVGRGDLVRLGARELGLAHVHVHLVAIEVGVVRVAVGVVHADDLLAHQHARLVRHDARLVQRRLAVDQQRVARLEVAPHLLARDRRELPRAAARRPRAGARGRPVSGAAARRPPSPPASPPAAAALASEVGVPSPPSLAPSLPACSAAQRVGMRVGVGVGEEPLRDGEPLLLRLAGEVDHEAARVLHHGGARVDRRAVDDRLPQLGHVPRRDGLGEGEHLGEAVGDADLVRPRLGSGEMTERHVKLTRLPIMFMRKRPCLRSSSCFTPAGSLSERLPDLGRVGDRRHGAAQLVPNTDHALRDTCDGAAAGASAPAAQEALRALLLQHAREQHVGPWPSCRGTRRRA